MKAAFEIQDHAFGLTPGNIVDASLMQMDRAIGLIKSGDQDEGCRIAAETVTGFSLKSRAELINRRAQEILQMVPSGTHSSRLREILD
jgi:hypothetical protein